MDSIESKDLVDIPLNSNFLKADQKAQSKLSDQPLDHLIAQLSTQPLANDALITVPLEEKQVATIDNLVRSSNHGGFGCCCWTKTILFVLLLWAQIIIFSLIIIIILWRIFILAAMEGEK